MPRAHLCASRALGRACRCRCRCSLLHAAALQEGWEQVQCWLVKRLVGWVSEGEPSAEEQGLLLPAAIMTTTACPLALQQGSQRLVHVLGVPPSCSAGT